RQPRRAWRTFYREVVWAGIVAPRRLRAEGIDLLHSPCNPLFVPPRPIRHVATVHDIAILRHPERFRRWHRRMGMKALERARAADRVICISRFTADELVQAAGFDRERIRVVHNGCSFRPDMAEQPPGPAVPEEFLLFVGSLEPGKNLALVRDVYELARKSGRALPALVIVVARFVGLPGDGPPP